MPNFFNFTLVTKPWAQFRQPASAYISRILTACLHSCSSSREALTTARDAQQHSLYRLETPSPKGSSYMARDALQHSLYRPETTSPKGSSQHRSREALTSPSLSSVYPVLLLPSVNLDPSIGFIYYLESTDVPKNKPTSGSGDLSPTLGEEVCAPLWCKTSVLLLHINLSSAAKSW